MDDETNSTNSSLPDRWLDTWEQCVTPENVYEFICLARELLRKDPDCVQLGCLWIHGELDGLVYLADYGELLDVLDTELTRIVLLSFSHDTTTRRVHPLTTELLHLILETCCLPKLPNLRGLDIESSNLDGLDGSKLGDLLCARRLHWLAIRDCSLTLNFLQQWKQAILAHPENKCQLSELDLESVQLQGGQGVVEMLEIVKLLSHLEVLRFSSPITDHHIWSLASCIDALPRLKELNIENIVSKVANESIEAFFRGLSKKQDLEKLKLKGQGLAAGPTQDVFVETVASLPALKTFCLEAEIDSPAKFLSSLLERLIQRQSKLTSLSISNMQNINSTASFMDECWFQWIPHLGPHFQNIRMDFPEDVGCDHPQWPNLISSMRKNGYLLDISIGKGRPAMLRQICRRNELLAQVKKKGCLSPAEKTTMHQQQWAFLLERMANRRNILDSSPLFSFVRYNVSNIINCAATNKRKMNWRATSNNLKLKEEK